MPESVAEWSPRQTPYGWDYQPTAFDSDAQHHAPAASPGLPRPSVPRPSPLRKPTLSGLPEDTRLGTLLARRKWDPVGWAQLQHFDFGNDDDAAARAKVQTLIELCIRPALHEGLARTRSIAAEALAGIPMAVNGHDRRRLCTRIFEWVRGHIRYVNDPVGIELFTQLPLMIQRGMGDCDDMSHLLCSVFMAVGVPVKLRTLKVPPHKGWAHIYPMAWVGDAWMPFDATENFPAGWQFPKPTAIRDYEVTP